MAKYSGSEKICNEETYSYVVIDYDINDSDTTVFLSVAKTYEDTIENATSNVSLTPSQISLLADIFARLSKKISN